MAATINSLADLERRRLELEHSVAKVEKSLRHWQTWEAEYEGFKEELLAAGNEANTSQILDIASGYNGEVLTDDECRTLVHDNGGTVRNVKQILDTLARRLDYVTQNVKTLQKQRDTARSKYDALNAVVDAQPRDEEGLPLREITEELDDDDNVISGSVADHNDSAPEILEGLRKRGVRGLPIPLDKGIEKPVAIGKTGLERQDGEAFKTASPKSSAQKERASFSAKSVRFATSVDEKQPEPNPSAPPKALGNTPTVHEAVVKSLQNDFPDNPVIPDDETPEQAALRRDMLQYNMNEVGAIVAEMDFDDAYNYSAPSESDEDEDGDFDEEEPEDPFGRTNVPMLDEAYRQEMLELERELHARYLVNAGPEAAVDDALTMPKAEEDSSLNAQAYSSVQQDTGKKKGVRFAESLDVQSPLPSPKPANTTWTTGAASSPAPIASSIIERTGPEEATDSAPQPKKVSRFAASRGLPPNSPKIERISNSANPIVSGPLAGMSASSLVAVQQPNQIQTKLSDYDDEPVRGPPGKTHADRLVVNAQADTATAPTPDELESQLLHQQVASEYNRMRNNFIQREGGFKAPESEDEEDEAPRTSRFMAARLRKVVR